MQTASSHTARQNTGMDILIAEMSGYGVKLLNTSESWCAQHPRRADCVGLDRYTWEGPTLGTSAHRSMGLIMTDSLVAARTASSAVLKLRYPSDHMCAILWSRCCFTVLTGHDLVPDASQMGFETYACAELMMVVRMRLDNRAHWGLDPHVAQVDFARAYDSILYVAILRALRRRCAPEAFALASIREMRRASMAFEHCDWSTPPVTAGVGLRQGCSVAPMVFRWILPECMSELQETWVGAGHGLSLDTVVVAHVALADDTWVFDAPQHGLHGMLNQPSPNTLETTGLAIRCEK